MSGLSAVSLLGLPEGDGFVPTVLVLPSEAGALVLAGRFGGGAGLVDLELGHTTGEHAGRIVEGAKGSHQLFAVPLHVGLHFTLRSMAEGRGVPAGWSEVEALVEPGLLTTAQLVDPLARLPGSLDRKALHEASGPLVDPRRGVFFELAPEVAEPAFEALVDALSGTTLPSEEARRARIAELVAHTADRALDAVARTRWTLAMDVATLLAAQTPGSDGLRVAARQTALALRQGFAGRDIPWLRVWTERQLAMAMEQVMAMNRGS